ncbi:MAG: DUF1801 domain-containing protein [Microbacteriaceae bacterium]|jgi:uncharacterized protein YdhG (YjbR/CyaY superfamily)|nr:DUF1801 domain-containing protein [Microbacteriaceae bacterium]
MSEESKPAKSSKTKQPSVGFTAEERAAMKEYADELKLAAKRGKKDTTAEDEADVLAKIEAFAEPDRAMAMQLHELVKKVAPELKPKTWYGMPAYSLNGKVLCFFQSAAKFKTRYSTLGFSDLAQLDDGDFWPSSFALIKLTPKVKAEITALVLRAVGR